MKRRNIIAMVIVILVVCVVIFFGLSGFSAGIYRVDPLPQQINLGLDLTGGVYAVYQGEQGDLDANEFAAKLSTTISVLRSRLDNKGYTEATIVQQGTDRIRVEVPINATSEVKDPGTILSFISETGLLEFKDSDGNTVFTGSDVEQAYATVQNQSNSSQEPVVYLRFNSEGAELFGQLTEKAYKSGTNIIMTLDGETISEASVKEGPIYGGTAIISGGSSYFTMEEASDLAIKIESGALPLVLDEIENRSISASLGEEALSTSLFAGLIGIAVLFVFMIIYYRLPGLVACIALSVYLFIIVLLLAAIPSIQLTLPGIAGIILGVGMAVDANVIIFERFKEELSSGKTLRSSLNTGFHKAMTTIIDSNITTIIAGIVIAAFGVGTVKGFGYTLVMSIIVSMFTAVVVTRWLMRRAIDLNINNMKMYTIRKTKLEMAAKGGE